MIASFGSHFRQSAREGLPPIRGTAVIASSHRPAVVDPPWMKPAFTDRGREGRYPPRPPNRACGSPAHGSPVAGSLSGISRVFKSCLKGEEPLIREEGISLPPWTPLPSADTMRSVQIDASVHHSPWASPLVASLPGVAVMALSGFSCAIQTFRIQLPASLPSGRFCCPSFPPPAAASVL